MPNPPLLVNPLGRCTLSEYLTLRQVTRIAGQLEQSARDTGPSLARYVEPRSSKPEAVDGNRIGDGERRRRRGRGDIVVSRCVASRRVLLVSFVIFHVSIIASSPRLPGPPHLLPRLIPAACDRPRRHKHGGIMDTPISAGRAVEADARSVWFLDAEVRFWPWWACGPALALGVLLVGRGGKYALTRAVGV